MQQCPDWDINSSWPICHLTILKQDQNDGKLIGLLQQERFLSIALIVLELLWYQRIISLLMKHYTQCIHKSISSSTTSTSPLSMACFSNCSGMLFKLLNSVRYLYTYQSHVYCGKPEDPESSDHYIRRTINCIKFLVNKLLSHHRLYTSFVIGGYTGYTLASR